jgi:hypothetical protein
MWTTKYHSVCPLVGIGTLPPFPQASVPLSPEPKEGGGGGGGGSQFGRLEKKPIVLCLLCDVN